MTTALGCVPATEHTLIGHPENAKRITAILELLEREGIIADLVNLEPKLASREQLARVHSHRLIEQVEQASSRGGGRLDADTYTTSATYREARYATGTVCALADEIASGKVENGIALVRPPGHHAEANRVGGFCLFNNVAAATRHILARYSLERVAIIDFDVHHGNGTQDIFYEDPSVLFVSMHLFHPFFYPGTGAISETGSGLGLGSTLNIPFSPGAGDQSYDRVFKNIIRPILMLFKPEFILVSAGFDAHWADPLAAAGLSLAGYANISREIINIALDLCAGKVMFVLEGGYHLDALAYGVLNVIYALIGRDEIVDPLGPSQYLEPDITVLLAQLQRLHLLS